MSPSTKKSASDAKAVAREAEILAKEAQDSRAPKMKYDLPKRRTRISVRNPLTEFLLFPKLPAELRLMVWALAAPKPATVAQRTSTVKDRAFRYIRPDGVPALLHACRESRYEYLEEETNDTNALATIESRRRKHPLYKSYFYSPTSKKSTGVYMSTEIDTFWAMQFQKELAKSLKRLVVSYSDWWGMKVWSFHNLQSVTVLIEEVELLGIIEGPITYPREVNGQLTAFADVTFGVPIRSRRDIINGGTMFMCSMKSKDIKWRYERQFIRAENLDIPEIDQAPKEEKASS